MIEDADVLARAAVEPSAFPTRAWRTRASGLLQVCLPLAVVTWVVSMGIHTQLHYFDGNLSGLVQFGSYFQHYTHPPPGAVVLSGSNQAGYDGQFYYVLARDPLLLHRSTLAGLAGQLFRADRIGYPALAALVSRGAHLTLPAALLGVNVGVVLFLTLGFAVYARSRGWSGLWALALGLLPGFLLATLRDLTDPLATAAGLAGLIAYARGHRWPAALLLTLAVLTREVMALMVAAIAIEAAARAWHARGTSGAVRRIARHAAPAVALPGISLIGWQLYVTLRDGGSLPLSPTARWPTFVSSLNAAVHSSFAFAVWDITYEGLMLAAAVAALIAAWRKRSLFNIAATLMAASLFFAGFQPLWGDTRDSLPLFALLLVAGLEQRRRFDLAICVAAATMTVLIPLAIPGLLTM